jgi:hypothetical protein
MADKLRPSLLGALLWIGLGTLFLLHNFGIIPDAWSLAARYWPLLLILLGAAKILDYFLRKDSIAIRAGELIGIIFLVIIGTVVTSIHRNAPLQQIYRDFQFHLYRNAPPWGFRPWIGNPRAYTEEKVYPIKPGTPVYVDTSHGSVSVLTGRDNEISIHLKKSIYAGETQARNIAGEIQLQTKSEKTVDFSDPPAGAWKTGKTDNAWFVIRTNRNSLNTKNYRYTTDLEVYVPKNSPVRIKNSFGNIKVADIIGNLALNASQSNITVENCTGEFSIYTRFAESRLMNLTGNVRLDARGNVHAENIRGDMSINNEFSSMQLSNIEGKVSVTGTSGNMQMENISKPVEINARGAHINIRKLKDTLKGTVDHGNLDLSEIDADVRLESRYMSVNLRDIRGNVTMDSNSDTIRVEVLRGNFSLKGNATGVWLNNIQGNADIRTTLKDVFIGGLEGDCVVTNEYAGINITAQKLFKLIQAKNHSGAIHMLIPESTSFGIVASARNGEVFTDYNGLPAAIRESNAMVLRSPIKGGDPKILLDTDYGSIRISRNTRSSHF